MRISLIHWSRVLFAQVLSWLLRLPLWWPLTFFSFSLSCSVTSLVTLLFLSRHGDAPLESCRPHADFRRSQLETLLEPAMQGEKNTSRQSQFRRKTFCSLGDYECFCWRAGRGANVCQMRWASLWNSVPKQYARATALDVCGLPNCRAEFEL